jgi:predicted nucleic acid-binding protein
MIVVSDTSPIRALAFLEHLEVLQRLFGTVVIPPAVVEELAHPARVAQGESPVDLSRFPFIETRVLAGRTRVEALAEQGILLRAKNAGYLGQIRPLLDRLSDDLGFFLADSLREQILNQAGE